MIRLQEHIHAQLLTPSNSYPAFSRIDRDRLPSDPAASRHSDGTFPALETCERRLDFVEWRNVFRAVRQRESAAFFISVECSTKSGSTPKANYRQIITRTWERASMKNA